MTFYQFELLEENKQADEVSNSGVMVAFRVEHEFQVALYQLYSFYVEVYYYSAGKDSIGWLRSFRSTKQLTPYLKCIDISNVI